MSELKPISINGLPASVRPSGHWATIFIVGLVASLIAYGFTWLIPSFETWAYDWRVSRSDPTPADSSILIVNVKADDVLACGSGHWNRSVLTQTISVLSQAGAAVIAPALTLKDPSPPECGDVTGNAKLLETTKQAGNVVYLDTVSPVLAQEARVVGTLKLTPDRDGVFRRLSQSSAKKESSLPFGLAVGTAFHGELSDHRNNGERLIPFIGRQADRPFQTYAFEELWKHIQERDHEPIISLVKKKIIMLVPTLGNIGTLPSPMESAVSVPFLHATILNAALIDSWVTEISMPIAFVLTAVLAIVAAWLLFDLPWIQGSVGVVGLVIVYVGLAQAVFSLDGTVWPIVVPLTAVLVSALTACGLKSYEGRVRIGSQMKVTGAQLAELREELVRRESVVEQLEEELAEVQEQAQESEIKVQELTESVRGTSSRLREAQEEMEATRRRLQERQTELDKLRKASPPVSQVRTTSLSAENEHLGQECEALGIRTRDPQVLKVFQDLKKSAGTSSPILLLGETGTGKELFANAVHQLSPRARESFIIVNVAAIRTELFESELFGHVKGAFTGAVGRRGFLETADAGTLFLDEIGELGPELQAKLLRVLEDGTFHRVGQSSPTKVDVRIVAATNRDLVDEVKQGRYREDLYYRLRSIVLRLPPLRERVAEDFDLLVQHLLEDMASRNQRAPLQITQGALEVLRAHSWPGNIRELRQTLGQAVALAEGVVLTEQDLKIDEPEKQSFMPNESGGAVRDSVREVLHQGEDEAILNCLRDNQFDMQATARALRWDRSTVTQRLKGMGFQALVDHQGNLRAAAVALAGSPSLTRIVELKLREYHKNLISPTKQYQSAEQALADCRKRFRNIPERHFPAVETLIRQHFSSQHDSASSKLQ